MRTFLLQSGFKETDIAQFEAAFTEKTTFSLGDYFIKEGETVKGIGFITKGAFRYFYNNNGEEVTRWVTLEHDFVTSLPSFINRTPAVENIQALKKSEMLFASKKNWDILFDKNETLRHLWLQNMEQLYIGMENRVFQLITLNAEQRYKWMCDHQPHFIAQVPDKYLASMLGITPRHLTRLRGKRI